MRNVILFFGTMLFSVALHAQTMSASKAVDAASVPQVVKDAQEAAYSGMAVMRWEMQSATNQKGKTGARYIAVFNNAESKRTRARYTADGKGISSTTFYKVTELPEPIKNAAASKYAGFTVVSGAQVTSLKNNTSYFRVRMRKASVVTVSYMDSEGNEVNKKQLPAEVVETETEKDQ